MRKEEDMRSRGIWKRDGTIQWYIYGVLKGDSGRQFSE
jgi:hypothetical protein